MGETGTVEALVSLAQQSERNNDFAAAEKLRTKALMLRPDDPNLLTDLGTTLAHQGRLEDALDCYERAAVAEPGNAGPQFGRSLVLARMNRTEEALSAVAQAIAARTNIGAYHAHRGHLLARLHRSDEAITALKAAVDCEPDHVGYYNALVDLMSRQTGGEDKSNSNDKGAADLSVSTKAPPQGSGSIGAASESGREVVPTSHLRAAPAALDTAPVVVSVEHGGSMIGDTLNTLPFILHLADQYRRPVHVIGKFHAAIRDLLTDLPVCFDLPSTDGPKISYTLSVQRSWDYVGPRGLHMSQGYFILNDTPRPELPITLPFRTERCELPTGFVVSPFCGSEPANTETHTRVWFVDRWHQVIDRLLAQRPDLPVYVIGGPGDDPVPYLRTGVVPVLGRPLPQVLDLLQRAPVTITIDTGTAHLAHFGGVSNHVLLYSVAVMKTTHQNPRATIIQAWPKDITANMVMDAVQTYLC